MAKESDNYTIKFEADMTDLEKGVSLAGKKIADFQKQSNDKARIVLTASILELEKNLQKAKDDLIKFKTNGDKDAEIKARMDIVGFQQSLSTVRKELVDTIKAGGEGAYASLSRTLNNTRNAYKDLASAGRENTKEAKALLAETVKLDAQLKKIDATVGQNQRNVGNYSSAMDGLKGAFSRFVGWATLGLVAVDTFKKSMNFEQQRVSFDVLFGSAEEGMKMMNELTEFAKTTPFTIDGVRDTAIQLKAYGVEAENIIPMMSILGNIAAGNTEKFNRLAYVMGQVRAANKLQGNDLRQFTEAGVPLIEALADSMGKSTDEILKMKEAGEITYNDVAKALEKLQAKGGRFENLMQKQSKTVAGAWSNIKDSVTQYQEQLENTDAYKLLASVLIWIGQNFKVLMGIIEDFGRNVSAIFGAIATGAYYLGKTIVMAFYEFFKSVYNRFEAFGYNIATVFDFIAEYAKYVASLAQDAFVTLGKNIPIALKNGLKNVGRLIDTYLLNPLQNGVNSAIDMLNKISPIKIDRASFAGSGEDFVPEDYAKMAGGLSAPTMGGFQKVPEYDFSGTKKSLEDGVSMVKTFLGEMQIRPADFKSIDESMKEYELKLKNQKPPEKEPKGGAGSSKDQEKAVSDAKKGVEEYEKSFDKLEEKISDVSKKTKEFYDGIADTIGEARDAQKELTAELEKFNKEANLEASSDIGERALTLAEEEKKVKEEIAKIDKTNEDILKNATDEEKKKAEQAKDIQNQIALLELKKLEFTDKTKESTKQSLELQLQELRDKLNAQVSESDALKSKVDLENRLLEIQRENQKIKDYMATASDEELAQLAERQKYLGLSETEQILADLQAKKDAKKEEVDAEIAKQERIIELNLQFLEAINSREREDRKAKRILEQEYAKGALADREKIEESLAILGFENLTREEELALQKQLLTAKGLEQERLSLVSQQQELLRVREEYNTMIETAFAESVDVQKAKMEELIAVIQRAQAEQARLNAMRGASSSAIQGASVDNSRTVNVTQTVNNTADAQVAVNEIVRRAT